MVYDLIQVNEPGTYPSDGTQKIVKLGICLLNDIDVYGENAIRPFFYINGDSENPIYLNNDGCYEISNEEDEDLNITSFTIPDGFPPFTAEYIVETGQK